MKLILLLLCLVSLVAGDIYMHTPRGSNNRWRRTDDTNAVQNANRLFDSQNNNKGGYPIGPQDTARDRMFYYEGSKLMIEWTAQHECGPDSVTGDMKSHCDMIIQYMCDPLVRDGSTTDRITNDEAADTDLTFGRHESHDYYQACERRDRNWGLFTADRHVVDPLPRSAEGTRQNNNEDRHGFECPEERDYYPYWHPTPWKDIAVLTSDASRCVYIQQESQNVKSKSYCEEPYEEFNNQQECTDEFWKQGAAWGLEPPFCGPAEWSRDNHLGNTPSGYMSHFNWTLPPAASAQGFCVVRIRYNISTDDYDGWSTDSTMNNLAVGDKISPVWQDPYVEYGWMGQYLSLALNTNQFGRTFQDRSHSFRVVARPATLAGCGTIWNVGVRGKRGNIVQAYPAVQYDFTPNRLVLQQGDCVHFQWTGSDNNADDGNPNNSGDQTGEGSERTDRSNICQIEKLTDNVCMPIEDVTMFDSEAKALEMAFINQVGCQNLNAMLTEHLNLNEAQQRLAVERDTNNCGKLNAAPDGYFDGGVVRFDTPGEFYYMSTRNNNFGWQTQKATIVVE